MAVPASVHIGVGSVLGSYRIVREIGVGGMGTVYEAEHVVLPRRAAIKLMHPELSRHPGMATRVVQEAALLEDIRHPGLVQVFECSLTADHRPWIAMELVQGETLASRLARTRRMAAAEVARFVADVADVLAVVHARGIIHRDLKPENLLLDGRGVRVIDWGVARLGAIGRVTIDGLSPGTPTYTSPEQVTNKSIGAPCDIYSLGIIAYEALAGEPPFVGVSLEQVAAMHVMGTPRSLRGRSDAPALLCTLIYRMLDKDPANRPTAVEIAQTIRGVVLELAPSDDDVDDYAEIIVEQPPRVQRRTQPRFASDLTL